MESYVKHERCAPDDPNRCEARIANGFCPHKALEGTKFCTIHTAGSVHKEIKERVARVYKAAQWRTQIGAYSQDPEVKTLTEEIGIMRMSLDNILVSCRTPNDLLMRSSMIHEAIVKIERLVTACHKLDKSRGNLLDKTQVIAMGQQLLEIIGKYISDPEILGKIATDFLISTEEAGRDNFTTSSGTPGADRLRIASAISD